VRTREQSSEENRRCSSGGGRVILILGLGLSLEAEEKRFYSFDITESSFERVGINSNSAQNPSS